MKSAIQRLVTSEYLVLLLCVICAAAAALFVPGFASWWNVKTILVYMLPLLVASIGLTFVLITSGIDLSITSIIAVASVMGGRIMSGEMGWLADSEWAAVAGILGMVLVGAALGALNGCSVALLGIPPFMATLVMMMFGSGFAIWFTQSQKIYGLPDPFLAITRHLWIEVGLVFVLILIAHLLLSRTLYGRWVYAVGHNPKAAEISGVPVKRVIGATYVLSGLIAAFSSILFTAGLETADPEAGRTALLDIIGATVIGGTSLYGGKGKVIWTVYGVLLLTLINNSLDLMGLTYFFITMVKGGVILLAAVMDAVRNKMLAANA